MRYQPDLHQTDPSLSWGDLERVLPSFILACGTLLTGLMVVLYAAGGPGDGLPPPGPSLASAPPTMVTPSPTITATATEPGVDEYSTPAPTTAPPRPTETLAPGPVATATPTASPAAPPRLTSGDAVILHTVRLVCIQVREAPGFDAPTLACRNDGTGAHLVGRPSWVADLTGGDWWWNLDTGGWAIEGWLEARD